MANRKPETRRIRWDTLVYLADKKQRIKPEVAYEFSNGRRFTRRKENYKND